MSKIQMLLELYYVLIGALFLITALFNLRDRENPHRFDTAIFYAILGVIFIFGRLIPSYITGVLIIILALMSLTRRISYGNLGAISESFAKASASRLKNKVFIPSLVVAFVAVVATQTLHSGIAAIGLGAIIGLGFALFIFRPDLGVAAKDSARFVSQIGGVAVLPQLLVALGAIFTTAHVGDVISENIRHIIPASSPTIGVIAYCLGMALFTIIMGNAFAAFSVITLGIGLPFVISLGADPVIVGALGLTAGYCGTLMTPMAANFNIMPASLLSMQDGYGILKQQIPLAALLLIAHMILMRTLAF